MILENVFQIGMEMGIVGEKELTKLPLLQEPYFVENVFKFINQLN